MLRLTDNKKTVEIEMCLWDKARQQYTPDMAADFFEAGSLPHDRDLTAHYVESVDYCIAYANDWAEMRGDFYGDREHAEDCDPKRVVSVEDVPLVRAYQVDCRNASTYSDGLIMAQSAHEAIAKAIEAWRYVEWSGVDYDGGCYVVIEGTVIDACEGLPYIADSATGYLLRSDTHPANEDGDYTEVALADLGYADERDLEDSDDLDGTILDAYPLDSRLYAERYGEEA